MSQLEEIQMVSVEWCGRNAQCHVHSGTECIAIVVFDKLKERKPLCICMILVVMAYARWIGTDYEWWGILMIVLFYMLQQSRPCQLLLAFPFMIHYGITGALLACVVLFLYDGTRGFAKEWMSKLVFYLFYPSHLLLIALSLQYHG